MKSLFLGIGILSLLSFTSVDTSQLETSKQEYHTVECKYSQCAATAESTGNQCKHCVSNDGDTYCWQHD